MRVAAAEPTPSARRLLTYRKHQPSGERSVFESSRGRRDFQWQTAHPTQSAAGAGKNQVFHQRDFFESSDFIEGFPPYGKSLIAVWQPETV
jgi:hypothetical protein